MAGAFILSIERRGENSWMAKWKSWLLRSLVASPRLVFSSGLGLLARFQSTGCRPAPVESLWAGPASHVSVPKPPPPALVEGTATVTSAPTDPTWSAVLIHSDLFKSGWQLCYGWRGDKGSCSLAHIHKHQWKHSNYMRPAGWQSITHTEAAQSFGHI